MLDTKRFWTFYEGTFKAEHRHPVNIALHVVGTLLSVFFLIYWGVIVSVLDGVSLHHLWLLAYPAVHAAPGLLGHKLFEPNPTVGDIRVFRSDFPGYWFLLGNHVMTYQILRRTFQISPK